MREGGREGGRDDGVRAPVPLKSSPFYSSSSSWVALAIARVVVIANVDS